MDSPLGQLLPAYSYKDNVHSDTEPFKFKLLVAASAALVQW